ncbi:MAG: AAA family ATPase [Candidatus Paceibacterota bacterium]
MKTFIYGVPGVGKTTYSINLQKQNSFPVVEGDVLRGLAQQGKTKEEAPFAYMGISGAFRKFGELTEENVIKGLKAVRNNMVQHINEEIEKYPNELILECAFLNPEQVIGKGKIFLLIKTDEESHRKQFFAHREENEKSLEHFKASRMIQDYLIEEAKNFPIKIIENNFDFQTM